MCFSVPLKVIRTDGDIAVMEGNKSVRIGNEITVLPGEYLYVTGRIAVGKLSRTEGLKIRKMIKNLNS